MSQSTAALLLNSGTPTGRTSPGTGLLFIYLFDLIRFVNMVPVINAIHFLCCAFVAPMSLAKQ